MTSPLLRTLHLTPTVAVAGSQSCEETCCESILVVETRQSAADPCVVNAMAHVIVSILMQVPFCWEQSQLLHTLCINISIHASLCLCATSMLSPDAAFTTSHFAFAVKLFKALWAAGLLQAAW